MSDRSHPEEEQRDATSFTNHQPNHGVQVGHVDSLIVQHESHHTDVSVASSPADQQARANVLWKVQNHYVVPLLANVPVDGTGIPLELEARPDMVIQPFRDVAQELQHASQLIPSDKSIITIFKDAGQQLLILGAPGAGKTTLLAQLVRALIDDAASDESKPMPVVFPLASWSPESLPLDRWLVNVLGTRYGVDRDRGATWLKEGRIIVVLDGLDEVETTYHEQCITEINNFHKAAPAGIVVCSRYDAYTALDTQMSLHQAIFIRPLSLECIAAYLSLHPSHAEAILMELIRDQNLLELAKSPLMLNILIMIYKELPHERSDGATTVEEQRRRLWDRYIIIMLTRRGRFEDSPAAILRRLHWLAGNMARRSFDDIWFERMQPSWLPHKEQRRYVMLYMIARHSLDATGGTLTLLYFNWVSALFSLPIDYPLAWIVIPLIVGGIGGVGGLTRYLLSSQKQIDDILSWTHWNPLSQIHHPDIRGLREKPLDVYVMRTTGGCVVTCLWLFIYTIVYIVHHGVQQGTSSLFWWIVGLVIVNIISGAISTSQYFSRQIAFRLILMHNGLLPWNYIRFFDFCSERLLFNKVLGSYGFRHRLLMDHVASLSDSDVARISAEIKSSRH